MDDIPERKTLSPSEAQALLKKGAIQLIDVREPSEFAAGRIPSARLVPLASLEKAAREWPRETALLLYCQSGRRSGQALARLVKEGFSQVSDIAGGISTWSAAGLPIEKSVKAPWSLECQVRLAVALLVLLFTGLGLWGHPGFFVLNFLISGGLIFSAVTNTCGLALVLTRLPWNQR